MKPRVTKLGHVGLTVRDIDRTIDFYSKYLGMRLTEKFEYEEVRLGHGVAVQAGAFIRCDTTHHELSIFKMRKDILPDDAPGAPRYGYGLHHVAFELGSPEDLKGLYTQMRDDGVEIVNCRKGGPGNQPRFYARDPDGNLLEFYWGIDQVGWDGASRPYDPIEEIDILSFDFEAYVETREINAAEARKTIRSGING
ncbi:VOC family protein (plasmid) [Gemmobacter fulvus]|uniref:VOC family protein n=1 Tax=Gemmobacter fulvus TaxID=2840474 RepID=A0A975S358_9RHOB|nr:VOC family protein [Gemmobacter fulvus]MBT9246283.1 VOC family protein [Gemmobacter fulvus]QWK92362.1 VOC family protein [Gemmobacter fulvus]